MWSTQTASTAVPVSTSVCFPCNDDKRKSPEYGCKDNPASLRKAELLRPSLPDKPIQWTRGKATPDYVLSVPARNPASSKVSPGKKLFFLILSKFSIYSPCTIVRKRWFDYELHKKILFDFPWISPCKHSSFMAAVRDFHNKNRLRILHIVWKMRKRFLNIS